MASTKIHEMTITHNFAGKEPPKGSQKHVYWEGDHALTEALFDQERIGIRFTALEHVPDAVALRDRLNEGLNMRLEPSEMKRVLEELWSGELDASQLRRDNKNQSYLLQLYQMSRDGGAVIAAYQGAMKKSTRLVGRIDPGTNFTILDPPLGAEPDPRLHRVLSLRLTKPRSYQSSSTFLGNLAPNRCTLQTCAPRARGRLAWLADCPGAKEPQGILGLHNRDAEWLVQNWLILQDRCCLVYKGGASDEGVDHKVWREDGGLILAQTTISKERKPIVDKLEALCGMEADARILFAPAAARESFEKWKNPNPSHPIEFQTLESVEKDLVKANPKAAAAMMKALLEPEPVNP
jgi:hypothetical protein